MVEHLILLHFGHLRPIDEIFSYHNLDVIHFVPTNISNSEKIIYASQDNRLEMLKIGLTNKAYIVDDRELCRGGTSYAIDTIKSISKQYGNANIYLIIGSDILSTIHK